MKRTVSMMGLVLALFAMPALVHAQAPTPLIAYGLQAGDWVNFAYNTLWYQQGGTGYGVVADPAASEGYAVEMPGTDRNWSVRCNFVGGPIGTWRAYAVSRCDATETSGYAYSLGIYDFNNGESKYKAIALPIDAPAGQYVTYDLGLISLDASSKKMVLMTGNGGCSECYMDRVYLVSPTAQCVASTPAECAGLARTDWIDIHQNAIFPDSLAAASLVADSAASSGCAVRLPGNDQNWDIRYNFTADQAGTYRVYVHARCDATASSGKAFGVGIFDLNARTTLAEAAAMLPIDAPAGQYATYDLGIVTVNPNCIFYMSGGNGASDVYLDRIVLIKETQATSISGLRSLPDNAEFAMTTPLVVTTEAGTFSDGSVYMEDSARSTGIRCVYNSSVAQPHIGHSVTFTGTMATDSAGERYVKVSSSATKSSGDPIGALGASGKSISQAKPNMSGLLGRAWGKVTYVSPDNTFYYIDDGSGLTDASGVATGLRVKLDGLTTPDTNIPTGYATKTGIFYKQALPDGTVVPVLQSTACTVNVLAPSNGYTGPQFELTHLDDGECSTMVDYAAPDGMVAVAYGQFNDWCIRYVAPGGNWHCYATVAIDAEPDSGGPATGIAFTMGIYDPVVADLNFPLSKTVMIESGASDGNYHTYDLGSYQLRAGDMFWFAAAGYANAPNMYVDKLTLVSE